MAPFSTEERRSPAPSRRDMELSKVIREAVEPAIFSKYYPRTTIDIFIEVLQSDGGTRSAGICGVSLALADAGVPMRDLVVACAAGKVDGKVVVDLCDAEDKLGEADLPVAMIPSSGTVTLVQMDGNLSPEEFDRALSMAMDGSRKIYEMQKEALKRKYLLIKEAVEEKNEAKEGE